MPDPLRLLYRADWTTWSLSAQVIRRADRTAIAQLSDQVSDELRRHGQGIMPFLQVTRKRSVRAGAGADWAQATERLLLAPGGRFRFERDHSDEDDDDDPALVVCDGESCWVVTDREAAQLPADPLDTPIGHIVRPAWMMHQLRLTQTGTTQVAGRTAYEVTGVPRLPCDPWTGTLGRAHRFDILVDAELGLVLRRASIVSDQVVTTDELANLVIDPPEAGDPASFRPPAGCEVCPEPVSRLAPFWRGRDRGTDPDEALIAPVAVARSLAKGAVYLTARRLAPPERQHSPEAGQGTPGPGTRDQAHDHDDEAPMPPAAWPPAGPGPAGTGPAGTGSAPARPISDATLELIAHTHIAPLTLTAQVHYWVDATRLRRGLPGLAADSPLAEPPVTTSFLGADNDNFLRVRDSHRIAMLKVALPDRYRIDFLREDRPRHPLIVSCDGERLRKAYHNRVVASPPRPLPIDFARLIDPAWLLRGWPLAEAGEQAAGGRAAIRLVAELPRYRPRDDSPPGRSATVVLLIDAELGIVLEQVSFIDGQPVIRYELRELNPGPAFEAGEFGAAIAAGLPVIDTDGEPIGDLDLPDAARAAGRVTAELAGGGRAAFGWLSAQARKLSDPPPGH